MTATHGDIVDAAKIIKPCKVLDLGCGQGRNSLYLSLKGYDVPLGITMKTVSPS